VRSRRTLSLLAVILTAAGTAVLGVLLALVYLLNRFESDFLTPLTVEIELTGEAESVRAPIMAQAQAWPAAEFVQFVPPEATLRDLERETGEDLLTLFGTNPFPPIVRVRFSRANAALVDSLATSAKTWSGVSDVVYPKRLWQEIEDLRSKLRGRLGLSAALFSLAVIVLVGLCFRAQIRNRAATWEFLLLSGVSSQTVGMSLLVQELVVGLIAAAVAVLILYGAAALASWLLLQQLVLPLWVYASTCLIALVITVLAGVLSPRRFEVR